MQKSHQIKGKLLDVKKAISKQEMDRFRNDQRSGSGNYGGSFNNNSYGNNYGRGNNQGNWNRMNSNDHNNSWGGQWSNDNYGNNDWCDNGPWDNRNQGWNNGGNYNNQSNWSNDNFGYQQQSYSSGPFRGKNFSGGSNRSVPYTNQSKKNIRLLITLNNQFNSLI